MPLVHDRCICLRKHEYSETSQIVTLFAREHGIIRAIAKGAHRRTKAGHSKFDGGVDFVDLGDAVFTHDPAKDLATLTEWHLANGNLHLRQHLRSMYLALYAGELVSLLVEEHDPHPDLFDRLEQTIAELGSLRTEETFLAFQLDLLRQTGYLPELNACVACGTELADRAMAGFSASRGGMACSLCAGAVGDRIALDPRLLRLVQGILKLPRTQGAILRLPKLTRHQTDPLNNLLARHVQHTLSRPLRLYPYVLDGR